MTETNGAATAPQSGGYGFTEQTQGRREELPFTPTKERPYSYGKLTSVTFHDDFERQGYGKICGIKFTFKHEGKEDKRFVSLTYTEIDLDPTKSKEGLVGLKNSQIFETIQFHMRNAKREPLEAKEIIATPKGKLIEYSETRTLVEFLKNVAEFCNTGGVNGTPIFSAFPEYWINLCYYTGGGGYLQLGSSPFLEDMKLDAQGKPTSFPKFVLGKSQSYDKPDASKPAAATSSSAFPAPAGMASDDLSSYLS